MKQKTKKAIEFALLFVGVCIGTSACLVLAFAAFADNSNSIVKHDTEFTYLSDNQWTVKPLSTQLEPTKSSSDTVVPTELTTNNSATTSKEAVVPTTPKAVNYTDKVADRKAAAANKFAKKLAKACSSPLSIIFVALLLLAISSVFLLAAELFNKKVK